MSQNYRNVVHLLAVLCVIGALAGSSHAEEIHWRLDYKAARREASETGRPLLLDFGNAECIWCRRLDMTTFCDQKIVHLLNERFIPTKVDGDREVGLVQALRIQSYPTLILAAPSGKGLGSHEGYLAAVECSELLQRGLDQFARMDEHHPAVPESAATPVKDSAPLAGTESGKLYVRTTVLPDVIADASDERLQLARELLTSAGEDYKVGRSTRALERCRMVAAAFPDLPEATEAYQLAQRIRSETVALVPGKE